jgi:hypothetical protein
MMLSLGLVVPHEQRLWTSDAMVLTDVIRAASDGSPKDGDGYVDREHAATIDEEGT